MRFLDELIQDSTYAFRQLGKAPFFTLAAVLTLAIGIGANTAIFSVVNGALLRNRPFRAQQSLVNVYSAIEGQTLYAASYQDDIGDLRNLDDVFLGVGAYRGAVTRVQEQHGARMILAEGVTSNLFPLVGLEMAVGRSFTPDEDLISDANAVAVLGHSFWQETFGGDPEAVGATIRLAGKPFTVVGVAPESFESFTAQSFRASVFVPLSTAASIGRMSDHEATERGDDVYRIIARLRPGVGVEQARARVHGLSNGLKEIYPAAYERRSFHVHPTQGVALAPDVDAFFSKVAAVFMISVALVLLLASTNLASSLLAKGINRRQEMAVRLALGAKRGRLVRQLLTETLILGAMGAVAGVALGRWSLQLTVAVSPPTPYPLDIDTGMDGTVLLFTLLVTGTAVLLAGLAPALQGTKADLAPALRDGGKTEPRHGTMLRNFLVGGQVAISMILLVSGGLFLRSLSAAEQMDPGFDTREAGLVWLDLGVGGVPQELWETTATDLADRARSLPGITQVGTANGLVLSESMAQAGYLIPGVDPPPGEESHTAFQLTIDHGFLETMGIDVVRGRGITATDQAGSEGVVLVSEAAAQRYWPGDDPLGKEITPADSDRSFRVVGVVRDTKVVTYREGPTPLLYFSHLQRERARGQLWLVAKSPSVAPAEVAAALLTMVRSADPEMAVVQTTTMDGHLASALFLPRLGGALMGFFGMMALTLATLGLYGVVSYSAARRTREVGIRMSLGATGSSVVGMVVRDGLYPVLAGGAVGLAGALILSRYLGSYLIGIGARDPVTLIGVPLLLVGVSAAATFLPARRASRVSPVEALRSD